MSHLKYLRKIIEPELDFQNEKKKKRIYDAYGNDPPDILKSYETRFEEGDLLSTPFLEDLFMRLTKNTDFKFHSGKIEGDCIALIAYRTMKNNQELDPCIKINDFKIVKARIGEEPEKMKDILKKMNSILQFYIKDKLTYEDEKAYKEDFEEYLNTGKTKSDKYEEEGNYTDLE